MTDREFEELVKEGIDAIPEEFGEMIDNVAIVIADEPTPQQMQKLKLRPHALLFGLYEGVPKTARGNYTIALPDKITIFKNPVLTITRGDKDAVRKHVIDTVWHEIGHHFGLSDKEIHKRQSKH